MNDHHKSYVLMFQNGNRLCRVPFALLAEALAVDCATLVEIVAQLAEHGAQAVDELRKKSLRFKDSFQETKNVNSETFETLQGGGAGEEISDEQFVHRLATQLGDGANIGWLRKLVGMHPRSLLEDALSRAMAPPTHQIRKSRGAYFTGIVRILAGPKSRGWFGPDTKADDGAKTH